MGLDGDFRCGMECVEHFDYSAIGLSYSFGLKKSSQVYIGRGDGIQRTLAEKLNSLFDSTGMSF